jgi:hypothetical protein
VFAREHPPPSAERHNELRRLSCPIAAEYPDSVALSSPGGPAMEREIVGVAPQVKGRPDEVER